MMGDTRQRDRKPPDLTTGPIFGTLLLFALPALGSNVLQSINGSINAIWVGQFLGETALAATANANLVTFLMFSLCFGFGMASTILIGQSAGKRDFDGVRQAVGAGLGLFLLLGAMTAIFGWLCAPALLHVLATPADVYPQALIYLRVMFLGLPSGLITVFLAMALRGTGDSLTPLFLMLPGMVVDIGLNPVFILGIGPAPRLGIMGAAIATLLANLVSFLLMVSVIYARDVPIRLRGAEWRYLVPRKILIMTILKKGIPMGLQMIVMAGSSLVMMGLVNGEGTETVAAYGSATQIWTYIQMPAIAIGMAVSTMAAQNIGAGRWDRVNRIGTAGVLINLAMTGSLVLLTTALDHHVLQLFLKDQSQSIAIGEHINLIAGGSFILMGITMVLSSVARANGATIMPLVIMIISYIPGRLGAAYALKGMLGPDAIWWSFPIGAGLSLVLTIAFYLHGSWRNGNMLASVEEGEEFCQSEADPAARPAPTG
ncbi:MAG TPA: MATE family efflux transporter [Sphingobium sp.]